MQTSDEVLVLRALLGKLDAYDELTQRYRGAVTLVAEQTLRSREAAEDVAQETFVLAFKALPQLQEPAKFASWIYAIARRRALRVATRENRSQPTELSMLDQLISKSGELGVSPEKTLEKRETSEQVGKLIDALPDDYRIVIRLRYFEEWSVARMSEFLSLPVTTVKWRLHHARKLIKRMMETAETEKTNEP